MSSTCRRTAVFLLFAFGISGATAVVIYATGGITNSPTLIPGTPVTVALALMATGYMFSPALANVLTRLVTREGFSDLRLRPRLARTWRYWVLAWLLPLAAIVLGAAVYFALFPGDFQPTPRGGWVTFAAQALPTVFVLPVLVSVLTFGEEFGWRAYLQPKLLSLMNPRLAMLLMGVIWGAWHWPVIAMGYNYGFGYPAFPWLGMATFLLFTFAAGTLLGWLAVRGGSVWPAVLGHATINATAGIAASFVAGAEPSTLVGPLPLGVVGGLGFLAVALLVLFRWRSTEAPATQRDADAPAEPVGHPRSRIR